MSDRDIWVDFNGAGFDNRVSTLTEYAINEVIVGTMVTAGDSQGNTCQALVEEVDPDGVVILALEPDTYVVGTPERTAISA